jgi:hypothetical protein
VRLGRGSVVKFWNGDGGFPGCLGSGGLSSGCKTRAKAEFFVDAESIPLARAEGSEGARFLAKGAVGGTDMSPLEGRVDVDMAFLPAIVEGVHLGEDLGGGRVFAQKGFGKGAELR